MSEGMLMGHNIENSGINIDTERFKDITQISFPVNKKAMQFF